MGSLTTEITCISGLLDIHTCLYKSLSVDIMQLCLGISWYIFLSVPKTLGRHPSRGS